jgi:hypothetical protein
MARSILEAIWLKGIKAQKKCHFETQKSMTHSAAGAKKFPYVPISL